MSIPGIYMFAGKRHRFDGFMLQIIVFPVLGMEKVYSQNILYVRLGDSMIPK
jgi:hypothetical protein